MDPDVDLIGVCVSPEDKIWDYPGYCFRYFSVFSALGSTVDTCTCFGSSGFGKNSTYSLRDGATRIWTGFHAPLYVPPLRCLFRPRGTVFLTFLGERFPCSVCLARQRIHAHASVYGGVGCTFLDAAGRPRIPRSFLASPEGYKLWTFLKEYFKSISTALLYLTVTVWCSFLLVKCRIADFSGRSLPDLFPHSAPMPGGGQRIHVHVSIRRLLGLSHVFYVKVDLAHDGLRSVHRHWSMSTFERGSAAFRSIFRPPSIWTLRPRWRGHWESDSQVFCHHN